MTNQIETRGPFNRKQKRILASAIRRRKPGILRAPHFSDGQRQVILMMLLGGEL
ncbi:hypothetical protein [Stenotrophomonas maltophilia]|uniref:hypothetical protein n=1 Tax=Stenotrophomonas maltophilia TaxID=40324 RepID=UPI00209003E0|nr:hypothetical protein [Stenotrophomonas maltophilia]MCO5735952.1 hypothetical protein [Stenotrophomonas maltophilia]